MEKYFTIEETLGYVTAPDETNTDERYLTTGSKNVLVDRQRKVKSRQGYTRLGAANSATTPVRAGVTWNTSTGDELPVRQYDDELEVYLGTVDGTDIEAWTRILASWSTTIKMRFATWWDATENLDLLLWVIGSANVYEWNGAIAVVSSVPSGTTVTKSGTTTFAENRFYTTRNKTFICARTGTEYTYTGGESTTTLTGIADTTGLQAGDILIQKPVTRSSEPAAGRTNHVIYVHENQVVLGSDDDEEVYVSQNDDIADYSFSTPRLAGEGALLTLDAPMNAAGSVGSKLVLFAGRNHVYKVETAEITVGSTLSETMKIKRLQTGENLGCINHESVVDLGDSLAYISYEPALRVFSDPDELEGLDPRTYSSPIQPDFDAEDFTDVTGLLFKNALYYACPVNTRLYILEILEDAADDPDEGDKGVRRFWQPPQTSLPCGPLVIIAGGLHAHSNSVAETYHLFEGTSDGMFDGMEMSEKLPINAVAAFAYRTGDDRANLKNIDEYYTEGQITTNTDVELSLLYDFGGESQTITRTIDGDDQDITYQDESLSSLGQSSLGTQPLGGSSAEPETTLKYRVVFELPKEDFHEIQEVYTMDQVDGYFAVLARGMNMKASPRRDTAIRK